MRLEINRTEGLRNDLLLRLERGEIETSLLSIASRSRLMELSGIPRHRAASPEESGAISDCKILLEDHLRALGIIDDAGNARQRAIAISNRNLGANQGHIAWQRGATPRIFRIQEDPCSFPLYSCLTQWRGGCLTIEDLRFDFAAGRIYSAPDGRDLSDEVEWATFGQRVLRAGSVARIEEIADRFYDIRHVLAFDHRREEGERARVALYNGYPERFGENVLRAWRESGVSRSRYFHNAIGISKNELMIVQREGTIEEIGAALQQAGACDGLILDNGGSIACWVWWANLYAGGFISPTIDYRPPGTSAIAFILKGPLRPELPGGSVSYSTY